MTVSSYYKSISNRRYHQRNYQIELNQAQGARKHILKVMDEQYFGALRAFEFPPTYYYLIENQL